MRAPDLFVIGAMKCGTTTLHADLSNHPSIRVAVKEAGLLSTLASERSRCTYLEQWAGAAPTDTLVDVSATYSMVPHRAGVAERAADLNPDAKIVYLCREPIARIISHHHHDVAGGVVGDDVNQAVHDDARFVDYTRYDTQLQPWIDSFGAAAVRVIRFEDYIAERHATVHGLTNWLGLVPPPAGAVDPHLISNATSATLRASARTRRLLSSDVYRKALRPLVPGRMRAMIAHQVLSAPPARPAPPTEATLAWLRSELQAEMAGLARRTGGSVTWPEWRLPT